MWSVQRRFFVQCLYNRTGIVAFLGIVATWKLNNLRSINMGVCSDPD
jgi:hypothetical protein